MVRTQAVAVCATILAVACGGTPTNPSHVSLTISRPLSPANGAFLLDAPNGGTQSIQLVAAAAVVSTAETPVTYKFEIWPIC
jgi:hypothetical protein